MPSILKIPKNHKLSLNPYIDQTVSKLIITLYQPKMVSFLLFPSFDTPILHSCWMPSHK